MLDREVSTLQDELYAKCRRSNCKQKGNYMGCHGQTGIFRETKNQGSKVKVTWPVTLGHFSWLPSRRRHSLCSPGGKGKQLMPTFLSKEPSNSSTFSQIPTSFREYNGKKPDPPPPNTGTLYTMELALSFVGREEQRGRGALPSFDLHLLSYQVGRVFQK